VDFRFSNRPFGVKRFSNRPFGVKRFQAIHHSSVDVAHGLVLLFGLLWLVATDAILSQTGRSIPWAMFRPDLAISLRCEPDVSSGEV
jgi:hypothetical protein